MAPTKASLIVRKANDILSTTRNTSQWVKWQLASSSFRSRANNSCACAHYANTHCYFIRQFLLPIRLPFNGYNNRSVANASIHHVDAITNLIE